jgi:alpha-1,6-mannosyltransferase
MRIAHLANFYGPTSGGLRTAIHHLGAGYRETGHEMLLVVPGARDGDEETPYGRRITVASPVVPLSGGYRVIVRVAHVRRLLERWRPDRIEVSDRTTLRGIGTWAERRGIPAVFFSHERADGVLRSVVPRALRGVVPITRIADAHNRGTARRFRTIVCTTGYASQEFDRIGRASERIPLGVDLEHFRPDRASAETRARYANPAEDLLVMASRLSREKRPDLAIDALRILAANGRSVRLVCLGTGAVARRMKRRARGLPVTFLGFVADRDTYANLLASADVVVAPGPIETFGLAALEALASGVPVVANAQSALPEVIGGAGLAADGTPEGFARAIEALLTRPVGESSARARRMAERFTWRSTVDRLLDAHGLVVS